MKSLWFVGGLFVALIIIAGGVGMVAAYSGVGGESVEKPVLANEVKSCGCEKGSLNRAGGERKCDGSAQGMRKGLVNGQCSGGCSLNQ